MNSTLSTLLFVPLVAFVLYRRVRRSVGRQPVQPRAMVARMYVLGILCCLFLYWLPTLYGALFGLAGAASGLLLAHYGLKHTSYEATADGKFYTPNRWIGLTVLALFLGRISARIFSLYEKAATGAPVSFQKSPLTLGIYFLLAAYYITYYVGVLRNSRAPVLNRETASADRR